MGAIWLPQLPDVLSAAGLDVRLWDDWESRSRSSGGYDAVYGIVVHHTASNTAPDNDANWMWENSDDRPIGAVLLERTGRVTIGAAGATNCAGKGGPWTTSKGTIPLDKGNAYTFSIEAANAGTGEPWPTVQQDAYLDLVRALADDLDLDPIRDVAAHFEWTDRKIDPAGPSRYASGSASWNMDSFRSDVVAGAGPEPPSNRPEEDSMFIARDSTTGKIWVGNILEKVTYSDDDAAYAIGMASKSGNPLRDVGTGAEIRDVDAVSEVSERYIRMMGGAA